MKVKTRCLTCGGHTRKDKPDVIVHEPNCVEGRCTGTHNPGVWPYSARCIKLGQDEHGQSHEDKNGNVWVGVWRCFDDGPSCEETVYSYPLHAEMKHDPIAGSKWVIRNRAGVVICRSPKNYDGPNEARESLALFMEVVNSG